MKQVASVALLVGLAVALFGCATIPDEKMCLGTRWFSLCGAAFLVAGAIMIGTGQWTHA